MKIRTTLVIAFFALSLVLIGTSLWLVNLNFQQGFSQYYVDRAAKEYSPALEALAREYEIENSWAPYEDDERWLVDVLNGSIPNNAFVKIPGPGGQFRGDKRRHSPRDRDPIKSGPSKRLGQAGGRAHDRSEYRRRPEKHRAGSRGKGRMPRNGLRNSAGEWIVRPIQLDSTIALSIGLPSGLVVGELMIPDPAQQLRDYDKGFASNQYRALPWIACFALVLALIVAVLLARYLSQPIEKLAKRIAVIKNGDFSTEEIISSRGELTELSKGINEMAVVLQQNEEARARRLADISHELRTPVAVLRGELEAMLDGVRRVDKKGIGSLFEEVQHLQKLIEDFQALTDAEIGGRRYDKHTMDLKELLLYSTSRHDDLFEAEGIKLHLHLTKAPVFVMGDELRLQQVIDNLLSNSLKYTSVEGIVEVSLDVTDEAIVLVVADSPPSVSSAALQLLFEPLFRADAARNRSTSGFGLGLAIVREIVLAHEGRIEATNSHLGGLEMTIYLPRAIQ